VDDNQLAAEAAGGSESCFELIVRRHTNAVWRLARSVLHDDFAAEEAVQDTFLKAHRGLSGFRAEASLRTWLLSICHRVCIDRLRQPRAKVVPLDRARGLGATGGEPELRMILEAALRRLPEEERQAFVLVGVLAYSREEAAQVVGVPASTMRSRAARARSHMAEALSEHRASLASG